MISGKCKCKNHVETEYLCKIDAHLGAIYSKKKDTDKKKNAASEMVDTMATYYVQHVQQDAREMMATTSIWHSFGLVPSTTEQPYSIRNSAVNGFCKIVYPALWKTILQIAQETTEDDEKKRKETEEKTMEKTVEIETAMKKYIHDDWETLQTYWGKTMTDEYLTPRREFYTAAKHWLPRNVVVHCMVWKRLINRSPLFSIAAIEYRKLSTDSSSSSSF